MGQELEIWRWVLTFGFARRLVLFSRVPERHEAVLRSGGEEVFVGFAGIEIEDDVTMNAVQLANLAKRGVENKNPDVIFLFPSNYGTSYVLPLPMCPRLE